MTAIILPNIIRNQEQKEKATELLALILQQCEDALFEKIAINMDFQDLPSYRCFKQITEEMFFNKDIHVTFFLNRVMQLTDVNEIKDILEAYHLSLLGGHTGITRTFNRIRQFYHWPTMKKDIEKMINDCSVCIQTKITKHTKMPVQIVSSASKPFEVVFIDIVGPIYPPTEEGNAYIFTCECDLSKLGIARAIKDTTAETVARTFVKYVMLPYKIPEKVLMDNGSCFTAELFKQVTKLMNTKKKHIAPYNPKTNLVERLHRTLNQYLRAFTAEDRNAWDKQLPFAIHSYNNTPHSTTLISPHELVFGFSNPVPTRITNNPTPIYNYDNYAEELRARLQHAHKLAKERCDKAKKKHELDWNQSTRPITLQIGDTVFTRNKSKNHKFDHEFEGPFTVIEKISPTSVKIKKGRRTPIVHIDQTVKAPNSQPSNRNQSFSDDTHVDSTSVDGRGGNYIQ